MNEKTWGWVLVGAIIIVLGFGLWWAATQSSQTALDNTSMSTTTSDTSTGVAVNYNRPASDVKSIVASISGASRFQSLFASTGVAATIGTAKTKQYTIFVPLDTAYSNVTKGTISTMTATQLKRLIQYHVVSGKAIQVGAELSGNIQALSGDPLNFSDANKIPMVNSAVVVAEYKGSNGIVYVINNVLIPPQKLK